MISFLLMPSGLCHSQKASAHQLSKPTCVPVPGFLTSVTRARKNLFISDSRMALSAYASMGVFGRSIVSL